MTFDLKTVQAEVKNRPPRFIFYGGAGSGKTTLAASMPNPIFLDVEDGLDGHNVARYRPQKWLDILDFLRQLKDGEHDFKTVVIDSLDWIERIIHKFVCQGEGKTNIEQIPYARGYKLAMTQWAQFFGRLNQLRDKGMLVACICHDQVVRVESPMMEQYDRHSLKLHKTSAAMATEWADCIGFLTNKVYIRKQDAGFGKEHKQAMNKGRIIITDDKGGAIAKRRAHVNFPDEAEIPEQDAWNKLTATTKKEK